MYFLFICMWCISKIHQWKTSEVEEDLVSFPVFKSLSKRDRDAIAGGFVFFDAWHFYLWPKTAPAMLRQMGHMKNMTVKSWKFTFFLYPNNPCMEYLPTFPIKINQMWVNMPYMEKYWDHLFLMGKPLGNVTVQVVDFCLSIVSWFLADIIQINIFKSASVNLNGTCDTFNTCFTCLMFFAGSHPVSNFRCRACSLDSTWFSCLSCMGENPAAGGRWRFKTWGSPGHYFFLETLDFNSRW